MYAFSSLFAPRVSVAPLSFSSFVSTRPVRLINSFTPDNPNNLVVCASKVPAIIRPVVPDPKLHDLQIEDKAQLRPVILKRLSSYVKENNLQDPSDKRKVICDAKLESIFGVKDCTILEMSKYITPYLRKPEELGGRYIEEARLAEEEYIKMKEEEEKKNGGSKKKGKRRPSKANGAAMKEGRKIFKPVILSKELAAICRVNEMPRQQIIQAIWEYIRLNNLQGQKGEPVRCDFLLKQVYKTDTVDVRTIMKGISGHTTNKE